jgi:hypothetical protein
MWLSLGEFNMIKTSTNIFALYLLAHGLAFSMNNGVGNVVYYNGQTIHRNVNGQLPQSQSALGKKLNYCVNVLFGCCGY